MNGALLHFYHWLPPPMRSAVASLRGLYLRSWRYGPETERLVEEALDREHWSPTRWNKWQEERLAYVLHRAATRVPYYRAQWMERRRYGDRTSWEYLENWPILQKEPFRQNPVAFVADDCNVRHMYHERTSGTTGTPLSVWLNRQTIRAWYALYEARIRRWNGVSSNQTWAILGGQSVVSPHSRRPPFWVWNAPMNQLYLSANHISRRNVSAYMDALASYRVTHIITYSSTASFLAREALHLGLSVSGLKVVITNAEPLFPWQRDTIRAAFGTQVRETYGMAELVAAASECTAGTLHQWPEVGWLELLSDTEDLPLPSRECGRLVCTGLMNADMPLVRYAVGDRGSVAPEGVACACGRTLPVISSIEGRTNDLLITRDGRRVYWLNPIFYGIPVQEAQIVQEGLDRVLIRYVPAKGFTSDTARLMVQRLQERMGTVEVLLEQMAEIPREHNGKFRSVICQIPDEEKKHLRSELQKPRDDF